MPTSVDASRDIEPVSFLIGNQVHSAWSRYQVTSDLLVPASSWQVSLGLPDGQFPPIVHAGAAVQVRVGSDAVMTGFIDEVDHAMSQRNHALTIAGRDAAALLVDCSAPIFVARDMTLADIVKTVVQPLGISRVRVDVKTHSVHEKIAIEPGDTAWDALIKACEANGVWPWCAPDGTLIVGGPDYDAPPVASLILRRDGKGNNVKQLRRRFSMARRYSDICVLGQAHGSLSVTGRHNLRSQVVDPDVPLYRPKILIAGDAPDAASVSRQAKKCLADGRLDGLTLTAQVRGHRTSEGVLWTPGQRVHVQSEPHDIDGVYFLMARTFTGGRNTPSTTELTLREDGVWLPEVVKPKRDRATHAFSPKELGTRP